MRVIAGKLGGRHIDSPGSERTHPMSDRIRGALFNTLGGVEGATVLDAFAGSGALGIEAISRGAKHVTFVEADPAAVRTIRRNVRALGLTENDCKVTQARLQSWQRHPPANMFDLILCDPPYDDVQLPAVLALTRLLGPDGIMVVSLPGKQQSPLSDDAGLKVLRNKSYGDARLVFLQR